MVFWRKTQGEKGFKNLLYTLPNRAEICYILSFIHYHKTTKKQFLPPVQYFLLLQSKALRQRMIP
jgi:hypothetical protein